MARTGDFESCHSVAQQQHFLAQCQMNQRGPPLPGVGRAPCKWRRDAKAAGKGGGGVVVSIQINLIRLSNDCGYSDDARPPGAYRAEQSCCTFSSLFRTFLKGTVKYPICSLIGVLIRPYV